MPGIQKPPLRDVYDAYKKAPPILKHRYHTIFFKEIFAYKKQLTRVVYGELFEEMLELRVLTRVKPTQDKERVILRDTLGALVYDVRTCLNL
jgi:hypothetical protein